MFEKEKGSMIEKIINILSKKTLTRSDLEEVKALLDKVIVFSNVETYASGGDPELKDPKFSVSDKEFIEK